MGKEVKRMATYEHLGGTPASPEFYDPGTPICPLLTIANTIGAPTEYHIDNECRGHNCGFWNPENSMCGIAAIGEIAMQLAILERS